MNAVVVCGARAADCVCALPPGHDGFHECGNDGGRWTGDIDGDDFVIVRLPQVDYA